MTTLLLPDRTYEQRMDALRHANEVRTARAGLKRALQAGEITAADVLADPPALALSMRVFDLLIAQRWVGPARARAVLKVCQISPVKTVGGLSARQRGVLAEALA